jgi:hypothetical protein
MASEISGRIQDISVRALLKWIRHSARTGMLLLKEGFSDGAVEFLNGEIVSARTGAGFRDIGTILLENKVISTAQLLEAADLQRRAASHVPLGRTLIGMGWAGETDIRQAMRIQVDQVIESLLALRKGCFEFHAAQGSTDNITQNVSEVIREADVRRLFTP